ncbi:MAG: PH domain-containing protein [Pseudomonadota bacterium]
MSSYIEGTLIKDERIIYTGYISLWSLAPLIAAGAVLLPLFGVGLIFLIMAFIRYKSTEVAFTNKRVIAKSGFISRKTVELNINKVESIQVQQGVLGRIFNFGTLIISGAGNPQAPILGISDPMLFRRKFMEVQDQLLQNDRAGRNSPSL